MKLSIFFKQKLPSHQSHRFVATLCATLICPLLFFIQSQVLLPEEFRNLQPKALNAPFFKFVTFGYWPAAVDWMWIQTLQIIGGKNYSQEMKPFAVYFYEIATDLDPRFYELYEQAGVLFSFYFKSPDESIHFLEKGIEHRSEKWNHPYQLHLLAAYLYSYDKKDWSKAKGHYLKAADIPGAPEYLKNMKKWLLEKDSEKLLAKRVLTLLIRQTPDEFLKKEYEERLKAYD